MDGELHGQYTKDPSDDPASQDTVVETRSGSKLAEVSVKVSVRASAFMSRGTLTFPEGRKIIAAILLADDDGARRVNPDAITQETFKYYIAKTREAIAPLDYDIRNTYHQVDRTQIWALINAHSDPSTQLATSRTPDELSFIKRVLDAMFETYNTSRQEVMAVTAAQARKLARPLAPANNNAYQNADADGDEATQQARGADRGLKHSDVERLLPSLVDEGWFEESDDGFYSLSPRSLMELKSWLVSAYNEPDAPPDVWQRIKFCEACKEIVTMLEFLAYRKFKKNKDQKKAEREKLQDATEASSPAPGPGPVLTDDDELFFERITSESGYSDEDGKRPPLPPRGQTPDISWESDTDDARKDEVSIDGKGKGKGNDEEKKGGGSRFSFFVRKTGSKKDSLEPTNLAVPIAEEEREKDDISRILDDLNLGARNNKTFSLSKESAELVGSFTVVLKDLVNGVPTAANDLKKLLEDHDGTLAKNYEKLPKSLQKIVTTLPTKVTGSLAPELLAVAAESQGIRGAATAQGGIKAQAKNLLMPKSLSDLLTKPGAIVGMLKAIMNALKTRWPAFIGTNVIWSIALFLLLFVLWYCHKRGREVRLEKENSTSAVEAGSRIEELSDSDSAIGSGATPLAIEARNEAASPLRFETPASMSTA
ncbi:hypothetical protein VMCG_02266 [Cytospora schulzeri]|uniref:Uncharacterized protein n=1 Tax=Cytospora schulzeri TaxID=448051 RepID=A0A423X0X5_9PEZI|nr:hypothetical protein VMCG_02266 [Valsa malicola]